MKSSREIESLKEVQSLIYQQTGLITELETDEFANFDLYANTKDGKFYIEVKERMNKYVELDNFIKYSEKEGWMCEQVKWDFLHNKYNRFINLFRINGLVIIMTWNLKEIAYKNAVRNCPKATDSSFNNYGSNRNKNYTPLLASNAKIYVKNDSKWDLVDYNDLIESLK